MSPDSLQQDVAIDLSLVNEQLAVFILNAISGNYI